jgi:hypothetical protein
MSRPIAFSAFAREIQSFLHVENFISEENRYCISGLAYLPENALS